MVFDISGSENNASPQLSPAPFVRVPSGEFYFLRVINCKGL